MKSKFFSTLLVLAALSIFLPLAALAQNNELPNPLQGLVGGGNVIAIVYGSFAGFAALFALIAFGFLIFSAFRLLVSHGNEEQITQGKAGVTWSVLSLALAILSYSLVSAVAAFFQADLRNELLSPDQLLPSFAPCGGDYGFICVFNRAIAGILALSFAAAVLMLIWGGFRMVTSGGNEEAVTAAKKIMTWALAGFVVVIFSYGIIAAVNALFP